MIAITGATGYLGGRMCAALALRGLAVRRLTRRPDLARGDAPFALDAPVRDDALAGVETLIHAAHDFRPAREGDLMRVNLDGSRRLLDAAGRAGVRRVLFISSLASFEGGRSAYGRLKWTLEREVTARGGTSLRPGTVYGRPRGGLFAALDRAARSLPLLPDFGPCARIHLVHASDLVAIVEAWLALETESTTVRAASPLIRAAHPGPVALRGALEALAQSAGRRARFLPVPPAAALAGLHAIEAIGLRPPFRSDSLIGMLHGNPAPDLSLEVLGVSLRPFSAKTLDE